MITVGKHLILLGQIGAAAIDQIKAGQIVLAGDLLRPEVLFNGHREIGAALDGGVITHNHAFLARNPADAGDDPGCRNILAVHAKGRHR